MIARARVRSQSGLTSRTADHPVDKHRCPHPPRERTEARRGGAERRARTQGGPQSQSSPPGPPPAASRHAGCLSGRISSGLLYDPRHVCPPFHMPSLRHTLSSLAGPQPYVLAHTWPLSLEHVSVQLKWPQTPCACTRTSSPQGQPPTPFPLFSTPLAQPPAQPPAHSPLCSLCAPSRSPASMPQGGGPGTTR